MAEAELALMQDQQANEKLVSKDFQDFVRALTDLFKLQREGEKAAAERRRKGDALHDMPDQASPPASEEVERLAEMARRSPTQSVNGD